MTYFQRLLYQLIFLFSTFSKKRIELVSSQSRKTKKHRRVACRAPQNLFLASSTHIKSFFLDAIRVTGRVTTSSDSQNIGKTNGLSPTLVVSELATAWPTSWIRYPDCRGYYLLAAIQRVLQPYIRKHLK